MPPRPPPSRIAAALDYLGRLRDRAGGLLNTVASTPGTLRPDEYQERFGLAGDPVPAPREVGQTVRGAATRFTSFDAPQAPTFAEMAAETGASLVPGVGQFLAIRDIERARRADDPAGMAMAASNFLPVDRLIGALRRGLGKPPIAELDVYHGTPHTYAPTEANPLGEFDASKIGTGEGAQAYGHGIYLAQKPEVAQDYQFMLSKIDPETVTYQGKPVQHWYDMAQAEQNRAHRLNDKAAIDRANAKLAYWENVMTRRHPEDVKRVANDPDDGWKTFADYANSLDMNKFGGVGKAGSLYKADLPDEMIDRMLDWDKPLSEQSAIAPMLDALQVSPELPKGFGQAIAAARTRKHFDGNDLFAELVKVMPKEQVSETLKRAGIPGIRYLDAGSRGQGGSGTRNFVVFPGEEKKVKILERNGQPAPERIAQALEATKPITTSVEIPEALHGSPFRGLEELLPSQAMEVRGTTWFSDNPEIADQYTFPREYGEILYDAEPGEIYKASLSFKNPLTVDFSGKVGDARELSKLVEQAKKQGYDGLIIRNVDDSIDSSKVLGTSYAVFDRNQIKLKK